MTVSTFHFIRTMMGTQVVNSMQFTECIGSGPKLKRQDGLKSFNVSKLRWNPLSDFFNFKRNLGRRSEGSSSPDRNQGTLHGRHDRAQCGIQWLRRHVPHLMTCLRATRLPILLRLYDPHLMDCHHILKPPYYSVI